MKEDEDLLMESGGGGGGSLRLCGVLVDVWISSRKGSICLTLNPVLLPAFKINIIVLSPLLPQWQIQNVIVVVRFIYSHETSRSMDVFLWLPM